MEMELVVNFVKQFIMDDFNLEDRPEKFIAYTLKDLETAMDFALISEGILKSDKVYDYANVLSVRLHTLANSPNHVFFDSTSYISKDTYLDRLFTNMNGQRCQIVNFNISI